MKMNFILSLMLISSIAIAAPKKKASSAACEAIQAAADKACTHIMCDDDIANGTFKNEADCTSAEDYAEGAQGACEDTQADAEKAYNKKHHTHVHCEE